MLAGQLATRTQLYPRLPDVTILHTQLRQLISQWKPKRTRNLLGSSYEQQALARQ